MPFGIQRLSRGIVASASAPIAASRPLHSAIACTVPMWLCTAAALRDHQLGVVRPITVNRGRMVAKYGAFWRERDREHPLARGQRAGLLPEVRTWLMAPEITVR